MENMPQQNLIKTRLTEAIRTSGKSITKIAAEMGLSISIIAQYCNTKKLPSLDTFAQLCKVIDVSSDYILGIE